MHLIPLFFFLLQTLKTAVGLQGYKDLYLLEIHSSKNSKKGSAYGVLFPLAYYSWTQSKIRRSLDANVE